MRFYATGSSTPLSYYTDAALSTGAATTHTLNSAGRPTTNIFLQSVDYKVTLEDSSGNLIWTADPVRASDFASMPLWIVGSGNPNGSVAGTAGSSGIMPTKYWDYTGSIEYTCTTTGVAAAAVWTALNSSAATPAVPEPQGRLTLTSASPVTVEVVASNAVYYTPATGVLVPIYNGTSMIPTEFAELTLTLVASHAADTLYDVFVFSNSGTLTLATGPAWTTQTPGSSARGTGAGTTQLARVKGINTNSVSMTGRNGSTTYTIAANRGTYLGTIYMDHTAANTTCHTSYGQNRKWGVWNAFNREPIYLKAGDGNATWAYTTTKTQQASNNVPASYTAVIANVGGTTSNGMTILCGLAEEAVDVRIEQRIQANSGTSASGTTQGTVGIGINSITTASGSVGIVGIANGAGGGQSINHGNAVSRFLVAPFLGLNQIFALEAVPSIGATAQTCDFKGTEVGCVLGAWYRG